MNEDGKDAVSRPFIRSPQKDSLVYAEAQKTVEFEADGRFHKFSIYDALQLISKVKNIYMSAVRMAVGI